MKKRMMIIVPVLALAALVVTWLVLRNGNGSVDALTASGTIEATEASSASARPVASTREVRA